MKRRPYIVAVGVANTLVCLCFLLWSLLRGDSSLFVVLWTVGVYSNLLLIVNLTTRS